MAKSDSWISKICVMLQSFGAEIEFVAKDFYRINDQLVVFVSAASSKKRNTKNTVVIHEDLFHTRKSQLMMRLKSQLGLNAFKVHGRSTRVEEISKSQAKKFV